MKRRKTGRGSERRGRKDKEGEYMKKRIMEGEEKIKKEKARKK